MLPSRKILDATTNCLPPAQGTDLSHARLRIGLRQDEAKQPRLCAQSLASVRSRMYDGVGRRGLSFEMNKLMLFSVLAGIGSAPIMAQVPQGPVQPRPYPVMQAPRPAPQPPVSAPAQAVPQTQPQLPPGA